MIRIRISWLLALILLGAVVPTWAASAAHGHDTGVCPFTKEGLAQLSLTPEQQKAAQRIVQGIDRGLRVPTYDETQYDGEAPRLIGWIPIEHAISQNRARLTALLTASRPNPIDIQHTARGIVIAELTLKETVTAGVTVLGTILTPEQRTLLPNCPRLAVLGK